MIHVSVYEQTCHGQVQFRVMRDDGLLIFDRHQTDFESEQDALLAIEGEFRRKKLGPVEVRVFDMTKHYFNRFPPFKTVVLNDKEHATP